MRESFLIDGGGEAAPYTPWKQFGTVTTASGEVVPVDKNGVAKDGTMPVAAPKTDGANNPAGAPGKAWSWNGTQWVQPPKPSEGTYTWDNDKGWIAAEDTYSQTQVDAAVKDAIDKLLESQRLDKQANVTTALDDFRASLKLAGLDSLTNTLDNYIKQDMTAAQIKINITQDDAYTKRFPGMQALRNAGRAVDEATYISMERGYEQVLGAYGLDTNVFGTRAKLGTYIANEVSPVEFENRVQIAADRVNKNTDVLSALKDYYGVDKSGAIAYLLDPTLGMDIVKKQARAAEIGAAAQAAGFAEFAGIKNAGVAESFVEASGTQDLTSLKTEFGKARLLATNQERMSSIEGTKYNDLDAVTAIIANDQQKLLESQRRAQREAARWGGGTGVGGASLMRESGI